MFLSLSNFKKFLKYYAKDKKLSILIFLFFSLITGSLEFLGVALIYPFIMLLLFPSSPDTIPYIGNYLTNFSEVKYLPFIVGFLALSAFILKNIVIVIINYFKSKFLTKWSREIMSLFMQFYIYSPYNVLLKTSHDSKTYLLTNVCNRVMSGFVTSLLNLIANTIMLISIFLLLLLMFPFAAIITLGFALIVFCIQNILFKQKIREISLLLNQANKNFNKICLDNILNLKDIKILSSEDNFYKNYNKISEDTININIKFGFLNSLPNYITEIIIILTCIVLASIISIMNKNNYSAIVASYALVAAAIFRIAPITNRILYSYLSVSGNKIYMETLVNEYEKNNIDKFKNTQTIDHSKISLNKTLECKNINFSYIKDKPIIKDLSFCINKGDYIGIIGTSGAGKSTLADIIMGILPIDDGEIIVDNTKLTENNFPSFRKNIGYVPQEPKILDKNFRENVAWGIEPNEIDDNRVIKVLKLAQIYDFIINNYKEGIYAEAIIASNGISQGQKQRLALARALYRDPEILILDEATSSLDVEVENEIIKTLSEIKKEKTIIAIAHRLSTLKHCNKLFYMKEGKIIDTGTFDELSEKYEEFRNLVKLSSIK